MEPPSPRPLASRRVGKWLYLCATTILLLGGWFYWRIISSDDQISLPEWGSLFLFLLLFAWISFSFCLASLGFLKTLGRVSRSIVHAEKKSVCLESGEVGDEAQAAGRPTSNRTAVLMPVYNESPIDVYAGVQAMMESIESTGRGGEFDFYILSDTTKPAIEQQERDLWNLLVKRYRAAKPASQPRCTLYYRHREKNIARKSGNIANFCENWGNQYRCMLVLDADSLMEGETMVALHDRMNADPRLGILQAVPVPIGRNSCFARVQQFAADVYGPIYVQGFAAWTGPEGNYFGHNAILRVSAFKKCCALPLLSGPEPFGGEILSHDFVEAALMLRGGYEVRIAEDLQGSYEECPTTISDFGKRDQRWCQGNLQHSRLLVSDGFKLMSRVHFLNGIMAYVSAPLWIAFLIMTIAAAASQRDLGTQTFQHALWLFVGSMSLLLAPKFWGGIVAGCSRSRRSLTAQFRLWLSVLLEILFSILVAPIMAVLHSRFVISVLRGKTVQWKAQQRNESGVSWSEATRDYGLVSLAGVALTVLIGYLAPPTLVWFSPFLLGMVLAIPIVVVAGSEAVGQRLRRLGLLETTSEIELPKIEVARDGLVTEINALLKSTNTEAAAVS